jgi:hypothetical protein
MKISQKQIYSINSFSYNFSYFGRQILLTRLHVLYRLQQQQQQRESLICSSLALRLQAQTRQMTQPANKPPNYRHLLVLFTVGSSH